MARIKTSLLVFGLLFALIDCSQSVFVGMETPTPGLTPHWPAGTEAALGSPTPWVGGTQTALAVPEADPQSQASTATSAPVPTEKLTDFSPVLYGGNVNQSTIFLLLGGVSTDAWLVPEISVARFAGEVTYSLHSFTQDSAYFVWGRAPEFSPRCKAYFVGTDAILEEVGFVGVADGWFVTKRSVTELSDDDPFYRQVVADWLGAEGVSFPQVDSVQVYRVDIEGDGTDEVFMSASHLDDSRHTTRAGDYSIILMRQVTGNEALTSLVVGDVYHSREPEITYPRTYSLANFVDLNQDGRLDVVVDTQKWEGFGARVFQIDGQDIIQTLGAEC